LDPKKTIRNMINTIKLTHKSDKDDYMQHLRLVIIGMFSIGTIGFITQFVFSVATYGRHH